MAVAARMDPAARPPAGRKGPPYGPLGGSSSPAGLDASDRRRHRASRASSRRAWKCASAMMGAMVWLEALEG